MGKLSRTKGHNWERQVAAILSGIRGVEASRNLTETREGNSGDVLVGGAPIIIQCKVGARPNPQKALREAIAAAEEDKLIPVAVVRQNRAKDKPRLDMAVMPFADWVEMVALLKSLGAW